MKGLYALIAVGIAAQANAMVRAPEAPDRCPPDFVVCARVLPCAPPCDPRVVPCRHCDDVIWPMPLPRDPCAVCREPHEPVSKPVFIK